MKGDYKQENPHQNHHKFQLLSHPSPPPSHRRTADYPPTSEEADSHSHSPTPKRSNNGTDIVALGFHLQPPPPSSHDGATIEVVRKPRGRPPGSKNRPKPQVVVTRDSSPAASMIPYVIELPAGVDIVESTARFCRKRATGLCVLNGNGVVANVTLKQPSTTPGATVTFHGHFDILSISATVLPPGGGYPSPAATAPFSITLAGPQGQVVGGLVVGPLISAATIYLIAGTFNSPSFERLQAADQETSAAEAARDGGRESSKANSCGEIVGGPNYSYHPADVIWAPSARQAQPPSAPPY